MAPKRRTDKPKATAKAPPVSPPEVANDAFVNAIITAVDSKAPQLLAKQLLADAFVEEKHEEKAGLIKKKKGAARVVGKKPEPLPTQPAAAPARVLAEEMGGNAEANVAEGFKGFPTKRDNVLTAAEHGKMTGSRAELLAQIPDKPGSYMFFLKAPRAQLWFPVYLGQAGGAGSKATLRTAFERYLHGDGGQYAGTIGDTGDMAKYLPMVDAMSRGFSVQFRFQPLPTDSKHMKGQEVLDKFDFPLNKKSNGQRHAIQVKCGRKKQPLKPVTDYPVVHEDLAAVVEKHKQEELPL